MTLIKLSDLSESIADALQFISYYHSEDFIKALTSAYESEQSVAAKNAIAQILVNSKMCADGKRPICQDTGIINVFLEVGMQTSWDQSYPSIDDAINAGVHRAYTHKENPLRASVVADPDGLRKNTGDNTPAVIVTRIVPGNQVSVIVAAKGGGSENKATFTVLNPSDDVAEWVLKTIPKLGAGWCPPGIIGIGIGGTAEKAMLMAKQSLLEPINIQTLIQTGAKTTAEKLRIDLYERINQLGIGAQGLGGLVTVLDVKVLDYPTHAASKPVALIPNCAATRHIHFTLDGSGPAKLVPPAPECWPDINLDTQNTSTKINIDNIKRKDILSWRSGDSLLISGKILTGRDAAHKKLTDMIKKGEAFPPGLDFNNRFIYYVGPVDPAPGEVMGPAGPTTASRMDKFTDTLLGATGLLGMIGKAERGPSGIAAIKKHQAIYLIATGGAAYLVSKAIKSAKIIAFPELGMEAIYEFEVENMPVTVAVTPDGESIHQTGPQTWKIKIGTMRP